MKKFLSVILALSLCLGLAVTAAAAPLTAKPTASPVLVNGAQTAFDAYNIADNNYFKLRDLAFILSGTEKRFEVGYDDATRAITLTSGQSYTAVGGEMEGSGAGNKAANPTSSKIYLDGAEISLTAYNIGGYNYFKLRDIGQAFNFGVDWDEANLTVVIDTSRGYTPEAATGGAVEFITIKGEQYSTSLTDLGNIDNSLQDMELTDADIEPLKYMTNLTDLDLQYNIISDVSPLAGLTKLTYLGLTGNWGISDISALSGLKSLKSLGLSSTGVTDISALAELTSLEGLSLGGTGISDISALAGLINLERLVLFMSNIDDISALSELTKLEYIWLNGNVSDISALSKLTKLETLWLDNNAIGDISAMANLTNLAELSLIGNNISDVGPLAKLTNLKKLSLGDNPLTQAQIDELQKALPNCDISFSTD
jgi:hypothetical protein